MTRVVIAGAGIAGASVAYFLARQGVESITVIERESRPGYHASGRSAAALVELETDPVVRRLLSDSAEFLRQPPTGFSDRPLLAETGVLCLLSSDELETIRELAPELEADGCSIELLDPAQTRRLAPWLSAAGFAGAAWLPRDGRIDVPALIAGYLEGASRVGARIATGSSIVGIDVTGGRVSGVRTDDESIECDWLINAAGAWASALGRLAGAHPVPLVARRRTIVTFDPQGGGDVTGLPLCTFDSERFYCAPEGRGMLASPMDEHEMDPCDARPDDAVVADALERMTEFAATLASPTPTSARAGLRTFAPDCRPVLGADPVLGGFFWLAGQGGCGIETSATLGRVSAQLIATGKSDWPDLAALSPRRF